MKNEFNVLMYDFNKRKIQPYNIIPFFVSEYNNSKVKPKTEDEFRKFITSNSKYMFWSRCEYEIIISDWPNNNISEKWDVHSQIMMNIDIITSILMNIIADYGTNSL